MDDIETKSPPPGFESVILGKGFTNQLGQLFVDRRRCTMGMWVPARLGNPVDTMHGGAMSTFLDMQLVALFDRALNGRPHRPTISLSVDFVAPVPLGSWVEATVTLIRETGSLLFTQAVVTANGDIVARSNAIYKNVKQGTNHD